MTEDANETDERQAACCGHVFQNVTQRRNHEDRVQRGDHVLCPCGDICSEGVTADG